jgi:hypothetical protein
MKRSKCLSKSVQINVWDLSKEGIKTTLKKISLQLEENGILSFYLVCLVLIAFLNKAILTTLENPN